MRWKIDRVIALGTFLGSSVTPQVSSATSHEGDLHSVVVSAMRIVATAPATPPTLQLPEPPQESWSHHFSVTEVTPKGHVVPLSERRAQVVDIRSKLIIKRTSSEPKTITVRKGRKGTKEHEKHFGVKVSVSRPEENKPSPCVFMISVPGLNQRSTTATKNVKGCEAMPTTFNVDADVAHGASFEINTSELRHGDRVLVEFLGEQVGERTVRAKSGCDRRPVTVGAEVRSDAELCPSAQVPVKGRRTSYEIVVFDYQSVMPYEHMDGGKWAPRDGHGKRFSIDNPLAVWMESPSKHSDYPALEARKMIDVRASAKMSDKEPRTIGCPLNGRVPTCTGFKDSEAVTIIVTRPLTIAGKDVDEEIARFELEAAAIGLHYLPAGNRRAYYSTASMVAVEWDDRTPRLTFAQTLGYSLYWKHRTARWVEGISAGAHFAILGDPDESREGAEDDDSTPVSFGIGGQLGVGRDALQVGGGYDVLNQRPYFTIGIGIPDAAALIKRYRK